MAGCDVIQDSCGQSQLVGGTEAAVPCPAISRTVKHGVPKLLVPGIVTYPLGREGTIRSMASWSHRQVRALPWVPADGVPILASDCLVGRNPNALLLAPLCEGHGSADHGESKMLNAARQTSMDWDGYVVK
jgi:hypothetical protein